MLKPLEVGIKCIYMIHLLFLLNSCNSYTANELTVVIKSELAPCEEQNVHFKVLKVLEGEYKGEGDFILPVCDSQRCKD